ncbi:MAG: hypothetical protein K2X27_09625 [Candidatus Obscuribacterales bacterium]|nr:hypothetical protein [Candidatus Obscuribacterales bacterium]
MTSQDAKRVFKNSRNNHGNAIAETGPMLYVLFFLLFFPLINLLSFSWGVATVHLIANNAARQAGSASSNTEAMNQMSNQAKSIVFSGIGQFANIKPVGGYRNLGVDLYIDRAEVDKVTDSSKNNTSNTVNDSQSNPDEGSFKFAVSQEEKNSTFSESHYGPNKSYPKSEGIDRKKYAYAFKVMAKYEVMPLFNFSSMPFGLSQVPMLGKAAIIEHCAISNVEHPEGLCN